MILNNSKIDQICRYLAGLDYETFDGFAPTSRLFDTIQSEFNLIQYNTGLRYIELFDLNRWAFTIDEKYSCVTAKGSNLRTFERSELSDKFCDAVGVNSQYWCTVRFDSLSFYYRKNIGTYEIRTESKFLNTHLFRHNLVKKMIDGGYTLRQVSEYLGERDDANTSGYRDSVITMH